MKSSNGYKRTPNVECIICGKRLYRRPSDLKKSKFVCCVGCRKDAYRKYPNEKALKNLELGREKGTNHLEGIPKSKESNKKRSKAHKKWCAENPGRVAARGKKTRGKSHYHWKGGSSRLNTAIRRLTEHRKWMDAIKDRDKKCIKCGEVLNLESHHVIELSTLVSKYKIKNRADAQATPELWDIKNGITLCAKCHYKEHGREYVPPKNGRRHNFKSKIKRNMKGQNNPNWKGGLIEKDCLNCGSKFKSKPSEKRKFCCTRCSSDNQRKRVPKDANKIARDV